MSTPREVVTRVGRARWDDHRFMGHGALSELLGNETFLALTFIAATDGRRPTREERGLLDALAVSMAAADPRIWPLKITRLVAAYGGTIAGFVAGQLCTECDAIGPWVTGPAAELLLSVRDAVGLVEASEADFRAAVTRWLETHRRLSGYGVAFRADDERFLALGAHVERAGRAGLPFWRLQHRLSGVLLQERGLKPNIALGAAALLLDMGLSAEQAQVITNLANVNTFYANAIEGARQRSEVLRVLPLDSVQYVGRAPRPLPADR
jgi:hypothetical protein